LPGRSSFIWSSSSQRLKEAADEFIDLSANPRKYLLGYNPRNDKRLRCDRLRSNMEKKIYSLDVGGRELKAEFNDLANQAHGSVMVSYENTIVLATAVMSLYDKPGSDFFPLTVDYEERFYASGQILGSQFVRREGKPSDDAILSGRIVDRTIRPLFDSHIRREIQVVITVLSVGQYDPDVLGVIAASLALGTSDIPWNGPVSSVRIGKKKGSDVLEINPNYTFRDSEEAEFEMVACGKDDNINMIEVGAYEISNDLMVAALKKASEVIEIIQNFQKKIIKERGKKKVGIEPPLTPPELITLFKGKIGPKLYDHVLPGHPDKGLIGHLRREWSALYKETYPEADQGLASAYFEEKTDELVHQEAIFNNRRPDGRKMDEVRSLFAQAGEISPILHGSGIFYRGQTHVLSVLTLGGPQDAQIIDSMENQETKRFMHHYNFPPFSTGEIGRMGGQNRRMIGHGALAEKALIPVIPKKEAFPYTIRIVSESMASNGSTSMASVCASTLALMDAGVPIIRPVAGIASGLMMKSTKEYVLLTDIQGPEDHHGDMDFKVAGTRNGITAVQMDVKVDGIPIKILSEALVKAEKARLHILDTIEKAIPEPRKEISPNAPKIIALKINMDQIGLVIGPGGKMVKGIKEKTGAEIDIEDDGTVFITGKNGAAEAAREIIENLTREFKKGDRFEGEITKLAEFGAFVRIAPNTEGLVHISEIAPFRIDQVSKFLRLGQRVPVIIKDVDEKKRLSLSIKQVNPDFIKKPQ
jgi:polyribonucleotide nucleotidyltransferase